MSIRVNFAGASLIRPGAYSDTQVADSSLASPSLGVLALIGEADAGPSFANETGLSAVTFGPDEFAAIQEKYVSGELVDAAKIAIAPSQDPQIKGGAQQLVLIKTNASVAASLVILQGANPYGTLKAKNAGAAGNSISYACAQTSSQAVITISDLTSGASEISSPLGGNTVLSVLCTDSAASAATMTIDATSFSVTVTGGTAQSFSAPLSQFKVVKQLVDFINSFAGFTATASSSTMGTKTTSSLDQQAAVSIKTTAAPIKMDVAEVQAFFAKSALVSFSSTIMSGIPGVRTKTFLSGGALGATSGAAIQSAIDACLKQRINFLVPLFSRDASDDIAETLTDPNSTYVISAIHAGIAAHCNQASTVIGRKERQAWVGFKGTYANTVSAQSNLDSNRVSICLQDIKVVSASTALSTYKQPHMVAVIAAAMKCAAPIGLPNTYKAVICSDVRHTQFDETHADQGLQDNLTFISKAPNGGFRFELDNNSYSSNTNSWIYNRPSVLYSADIAAYSIRLNTEQFVGQRNSDVSEESVKNLLVGVMDQLKSAGIIVGDAPSKGKGYKDLSVKILGSILNISVTLVLVEGLEFVLNTIKVQRAG